MSKKIAVIFIILLTLMGCSKKKEEEIVFVTADQPIEVEYGEEVDLLSSNIILETNGEISTKDFLDSTIEGKQEIHYRIVLNGKEDIEIVQFIVKEKGNNIYGFTAYECPNNVNYYFNSNKIGFVFNPDGNHDTNVLNLAIGDESSTYYGYYKKVAEGIYSFKIIDPTNPYGERNAPFFELKDRPLFSSGEDGYFKLDGNLLYFITEDISLEEMQNYTSNLFCELR